MFQMIYSFPSYKKASSKIWGTCTNLRGPCVATDEFLSIYVYCDMINFDLFYHIILSFIYHTFFLAHLFHLPCTLLKYVFLKKKKEKNSWSSWEKWLFHERPEGIITIWNFISSETIFRKWMWNKNIFLRKGN